MAEEEEDIEVIYGDMDDMDMKDGSCEPPWALFATVDVFCVLCTREEGTYIQVWRFLDEVQMISVAHDLTSLTFSG